MLDPHTMTLAVTTLGIGWLMTHAGLSKSALELRQRRRICPSCGRHMQKSVCSTCAAL
jgi:predicted amidophosphoribosyltransferase